MSVTLNRVRAVAKALQDGPLSKLTIAERLDCSQSHVEVCMMMLKRAGVAKVMPERVREQSEKRPVVVYGLTGVSPECVTLAHAYSEQRRPAAHVTKRAPREKTKSGSGKIAGPCISRSLKWNSGIGKMW